MRDCVYISVIATERLARGDCCRYMFHMKKARSLSVHVLWGGLRGTWILTLPLIDGGRMVAT